MRQLLQWLSAPDDAINKLALEALRVQQDTTYLEQISLPKFDDKELPKDSVLLSADSVNEQTIPAIEYVYSRGLTLDDYDFYVSKAMPDRLIIPFKFENRIVGYTARKLSEGKPKYISEQTPGYVFNLDAQAHIKWNDERYVLVVEGPADALSVGGVAILGAEIMDKQAMLINKLGMIPVLVPDRDADGLRSIEQALTNKWKVSLPDWHQDIKDSNDAVRKYGRLWTIKSILDGIETNELKVRLRMKKWVSLNE
jgi:hypothetical protein